VAEGPRGRNAYSYLRHEVETNCSLRLYQIAHFEIFVLSLPASEAAVLKYFQARMPCGLVVLRPVCAGFWTVNASTRHAHQCPLLREERRQSIAAEAASANMREPSGGREDSGGVPNAGR
jgi:hypothetical protein